MNHLSRAQIWYAMIGLTLVGAFLRFYTLGERSVWDGEIFTLLFAQYDWNILAASVGAFSAHPPLWFALTKLAIFSGWNETMLRIPAVLAGILSVPAMYVLGKRFFDARVGLLGAALFALSPLAVLTAQNARNYSLFVLLVILMLYSIARATSRANGKARFGIAHARWWVLFAFTGLVGLYTHYLYVLPLAGAVLGVTIKLLYDARKETGASKGKFAWLGVALLSARGFLIALIVIGALYVPWTPAVRSAFLDRQLTREESNQDEEWALTFQDIPRTLKDFTGAETWGLALFVALALVGLVWTWRKQKRAGLFWIFISLVLPILVLVLLAPRRLPAKYVIYVFPAYLLFVGAGVVGVVEFLQTRVLHSPRRALAAGAALCALLVIVTLPNMPYWNGTQTIFTGKGWKEMDASRQWRQVAASVMSQAAPGDFVMFPIEARALTARMIVPYFDNAFLHKLYDAPPSGRAWWVSLKQDIVASNAPRVRATQTFDDVVVQEMGNFNALAQYPLPNASFENGLESWSASNQAAVWEADPTHALDGNASLRVTLPRPSNTTLRSTEFPVTPGKLYRVTAYVQAPTSGFYTVSPQLFVNFSTAENKIPRRTRLPTIVPTDKPGWVRMVVDGIVPEDAHTARVEFVVRDYGYTFNPTNRLDDVRVWLEE